MVKYTLVYDAVTKSSDLNKPRQFFCVMMAIMVFGVACTVYKCITDKENRKKAIIVLVIFAISFVLSINSEINIMNGIKRIYYSYENGEGVVVEGPVKNFNPYTNHEETFTVGDTEFFFPLYYPIGYDVLKQDGGVITGDGLYVRITYVTENGAKYIMKLEMISPEGSNQLGYG